MALYLVAFEFVEKEPFDYEPLWAELARLEAHRTLESACLLSIDFDQAERLVRYLRQYVHTEDRLWVTRLSADHYYANAKQGTNAWLTANPP